MIIIYVILIIIIILVTMTINNIYLFLYPRFGGEKVFCNSPYLNGGVIRLLALKRCGSLTFLFWDLKKHILIYRKGFTLSISLICSSSSDKKVAVSQREKVSQEFARMIFTMLLWRKVTSVSVPTFFLHCNSSSHFTARFLFFVFHFFPKGFCPCIFCFFVGFTPSLEDLVELWRFSWASLSIFMVEAAIEASTCHHRGFEFTRKEEEDAWHCRDNITVKPRPTVAVVHGRRPCLMFASNCCRIVGCLLWVGRIDDPCDSFWRSWDLGSSCL